MNQTSPYSLWLNTYELWANHFVTASLHICKEMYTTGPWLLNLHGVLQIPENILYWRAVTWNLAETTDGDLNCSLQWFMHTSIPEGRNQTCPLVSVMYPLVMVLHPLEMVMKLLLNLSQAEQDKEDIRDRKNKSNSTYLAKNKMSCSCIHHSSAPLLHWKM